MAKLFYTNIDLKGNQLLNGVIHSDTAAPTALGAGQVYYNTNDKLMYQYDGEKWVVVGGSVANLATDVKKVVTGSTTSNGTANLQTTDLKDMKVGVGLQNLAGVTDEATLSQEFQAIDTALQEVKTTYVKAGSTYTDGQLLVAGVNGAIETASTTGYSIETTLDASHANNIPTSKAVADYVGSLAGGINYKGTIGTGGTVQTLPNTEVKVGDAYAVTTKGTYSPLTEESEVGDLIICNGTTPISWTEIPINFTVDNKNLTNFAPQDGIQTIATVDGKDITLSLQAISVSTPETGNVVTGVSADGNNKLTLTKGNALTTVSSAGSGVVTSVAKNSDNQTIDVTLTDLTTSAPTGIQYVKSISQASNGKVTVDGTNFDGTVPTSSPSTSNAPTTKAVKDYVDGKIDGLDGSATIASVADSVVTLKAGITETNGVVSNNSDSNIVLAKVAKTGKAEDVATDAIMNGDEIIVPVGTVQESLQHIAMELNAAVAGSVASFGGQTGVITVGKGLTMGTGDTGKEVSANVAGYIVNNAGDNSNALNINSNKIDSAYTTANTENLATVGTVKTAIEGLDVSNISGFGQGKTLATLAETDGKIEASFQDIVITHSQVSDWSSNIGVQSVITGTANGTIGVSTNGGAAADVAVKGLQTAAYVNVDYFEKKFTDGSHNVVTIGGYTPSSGEIATQKVEFFDGTQTNGALGTSAVTDTLYISKAVTASNPIITNDDLSGITGAMVYKGVVDGTHALPTTNITAGWTYVVAAAGTYAGQACEVGDMIIAKNTTATPTDSDWNVINGENQVTNAGATITAGAGTATTIATVDGTNIATQVSVTAGTATIAYQTGNVVTIKSGVAQTGTSGTIGNDSGTDIVLDDVAVTGDANELTVTSATYGGSEATTNAQTALTNLASAITNANITIDGHKGAITTGDGITDVAADGGSFGIQIDSTNANGLSVGASGLAMAKATGSTFGTVEVTAGNGLTLTNGVVAYAHNTSAITVASKDESTNVITINGTLTPDASDAITTSNAITLAAVAATGAANELTVTSGTYGGSNATTNAQTALDNLASSAVLVYKSGTLSFSNNTATIRINNADLQNSAITEIRDSSHNVVECDVVYTNATTITVTANGNPTGLYAIVHYKKA